LIELQRKYSGVGGEFGEQLRNQSSQELTRLYEGLSPRAQAEIARNPAFRNTFAGAYRNQAAYTENDVGRQIARNVASLDNVRLARQKLSELSRLSPGQDPNVTRKAFLDITGSLSREELTPDLVKGRSVAMIEEAKYIREREKRAEAAMKATAEFQTGVIGKLDSMLKAVGARNDKVIVEVLDKTDTAKISTLGQSF
jgi:hypothetical protein